MYTIKCSNGKEVSLQTEQFIGVDEAELAKVVDLLKTVGAEESLESVIADPHFVKQLTTKHTSTRVLELLADKVWLETVYEKK